VAATALNLAVAKTGIDYNTLQQKSRAALTTILGGAQQANEQMDKLDEFARTSPFSKAVFIDAQQQMLGFGIEAKKVIPYLNAINETVAATGPTAVALAGATMLLSMVASDMANYKAEVEAYADALKFPGLEADRASRKLAAQALAAKGVAGELEYLGVKQTLATDAAMGRRPRPDHRGLRPRGPEAPRPGRRGRRRGQHVVRAWPDRRQPHLQARLRDRSPPSTRRSRSVDCPPRRSRPSLP